METCHWETTHEHWIGWTYPRCFTLTRCRTHEHGRTTTVASGAHVLGGQQARTPARQALTTTIGPRRPGNGHAWSWTTTIIGTSFTSHDVTAWQAEAELAARGAHAEEVITRGDWYTITTWVGSFRSQTIMGSGAVWYGMDLSAHDLDDDSAGITTARGSSL